MLSSCTDNVDRNSNEVSTDAIFFDYKIKGEEKDSIITVYLQFRIGGPNGVTLLLDDPAKVELDGELIPVDSAKLTGAYYEIQKPLGSFIGKHTITFIDLDRKEYKEEFEYGVFGLRSEMPSIVHRGNMIFNLDGIKNNDLIRVTATDTSFSSRDINEIDTARNGRLIISSGKLKNLVNGPIILLFSKETVRQVKNGTKAGGRIITSYGLQREFELQDSADR